MDLDAQSDIVPRHAQAIRRPGDCGPGGRMALRVSRLASLYLGNTGIYWHSFYSAPTPMEFALFSLLCSFFIFLTAWLVLPLLVLFPLALFFAMKFYKRTMHRYPAASNWQRLLALLPLFIAIASIPLSLIFINANYRA